MWPDRRCPRCGSHHCPFGERSEEHTSELQSQSNLVCRLLLEKKKNTRDTVVLRVHALGLRTSHRTRYARQGFVRRCGPASAMSEPLTPLSHVWTASSSRLVAS